MSRDYAKRNTSRKKSRKSNKLLWLMLLLLFVALITSLVMPDKYRHQIRELLSIIFLTKSQGLKHSNPVAISGQTLIKKIATKEIALEKKVPKEDELKKELIKTATIPQFDFYNILPQKKDKKDNGSKNKTETTYELSVATVNDFAAADQLKAELALFGFTASITPVYQKGKQKHCISIGPYDNKDKALADQNKLKKNNIKSQLKKVR